MSSLKELIVKLSEAPGCPGYEGSISDIIKEEISGHADNVTVDALNNILASKGSGKTVMIAAHMDEIGLLVKHVDSKGFVRFAKLGGISDQLLQGQRVTIFTNKGPVPGVVGCKPIHLMSDHDRKKLVGYDKMFIDIGAGSAEEAGALGMRIGDPIVIDRKVTELKNGLICGKALDDRVGCAILIEVLKRVQPRNRLVAAFTIQEEIGLKGATVSAFAVSPDLGLAVDTGIAADHPEVTEHEGPIKLGHGPAILAADGRRDSLSGGLVCGTAIRDWLIKLAEEKGIPYQLEVFEGGTTDATVMQLSRSGVPTGVVSVPSRYIHTFSEVVAMEDVENVVKLITAVVEADLPV
ncbi:MAG: M42 family metallopeptidase [Dehalococcoidia bacterium]|nr:M42 family metallopeptidase [Dehalococcoidia bacterium]MDZ4245952.1 M42 family metallopeptidase [Dehalococcoidia bacterium]